MLVLERKAPKYLSDVEVLLAEMSYELIPAVDHAEKLIRDAKDQPILNAAIVSDVDIILTGDKDFLSLNMEHPKCMTVTQFFERDISANKTSTSDKYFGAFRSKTARNSIIFRSHKTIS